MRNLPKWSWSSSPHRRCRKPTNSHEHATPDVSWSSGPWKLMTLRPQAAATPHEVVWKKRRILCSLPKTMFHSARSPGKRAAMTRQLKEPHSSCSLLPCSGATSNIGFFAFEIMWFFFLLNGYKPARNWRSRCCRWFIIQAAGQWLLSNRLNMVGIGKKSILAANPAKNRLCEQRFPKPSDGKTTRLINNFLNTKYKELSRFELLVHGRLSVTYKVYFVFTRDTCSSHTSRDSKCWAEAVQGPGGGARCVPPAFFSSPLRSHSRAAWRGHAENRKELNSLQVGSRRFQNTAFKMRQPQQDSKRIPSFS